MIHFSNEKLGWKIPPCFAEMAKNFGGIIDMGKCETTNIITEVTCERCIQLIHKMKIV